MVVWTEQDTIPRVRQAAKKPLDSAAVTLLTRSSRSHWGHNTENENKGKSPLSLNIHSHRPSILCCLAFWHYYYTRIAVLFSFSLCGWFSLIMYSFVICWKRVGVARNSQLLLLDDEFLLSLIRRGPHGKKRGGGSGSRGKTERKTAGTSSSDCHTIEAPDSSASAGSGSPNSARRVVGSMYHGMCS